jgi:hypothetical protein
MNTIHQQFLFIMLLLFFSQFALAQQRTISGTITDSKTGETLIGVTIACIQEAKGTITNEFGFYSIDVKNNCALTFSYIGYQSQIIQIIPGTVVPLNISLIEETNQLKEVIVTSVSKQQTLEKYHTGYTKLDMKQVSSVPVLGGERDIIKVLQLMPGVKKEHDGNAGMLVRGGSGDQNLILLDDAPVYNATHLMGFFSVFNNDAIKDVSLQKGGFTSNYGGRLSSVMDIRTKDGNMKKIEVHAGVGLLSARASIEAPIIKDKMSFIISARRTYVDQVYKAIGLSMPFYFYDINAKVNYRISDNDQLFFSTYSGKDVLRFANEKTSSPYQADFSNQLSNNTATLRWNHVYENQKLFQHVSFIHTRFNYELHNKINENEMKIYSSIEDYSIKANYDYYLNNRNHIQFGSELTRHHFRPNKASVKGHFSESITQGEGKFLMMDEMALYANNNQQIASRVHVQYGLRISGANAYSNFYHQFEPRLGLSYSINSSQQLKAAYSHMTQYIHLVTGASTMPSDIWYPSTEQIKPQQSKQITLGYTKNITDDVVFSAESYYKWQYNLVEFKEGTITFTNDNVEQDFTQGNGKAYGIELMLLKKVGKCNGWLGYTLAYSKRQFNELNNGEEFYSRFDRRHDISLVANYEYSPRITFSAVFAFATGSRFTPIIGQYFVPNGSYTNVVAMPIYGKRNSVVLAPSHRLDINIVIKSKPTKKIKGEWHIGAYNVYNQTQPYRIRLNQNEDGTLSYKQVGLFGFIPSLGYNIKF